MPLQCLFSFDRYALHLFDSTYKLSTFKAGGTLLLPKLGRIYRLASTHQVREQRLAPHTLKPTLSFNIIRWCLPGRNELLLCFTTTDQSSEIIVSHHLSNRWKCIVPYSVFGEVTNLSHLRSTLWHYQSLFCSLPFGFTRNLLVATFTPKCFWCLRSVTLRQRLQICSSTIQTATITQLLRLLSFGPVRFSVVPYSISCEITATISEGF